MDELEMESAVDRLYGWIRDRYERNEQEEDFFTDVDLRVGADTNQINQCEEFIGRNLSPSYRHFLTLHNGWRGFDRGEGWLFGTDDYRVNRDARKIIATVFRALIDSRLHAHDGEWFEAWPIQQDEPPDFYLPENFYRMIDGRNSDTRYRHLLKFIASHEDAESDLLLFNQTLIGVTNSAFIFLESQNVRPDGEMEVLIFGVGYDSPVRDSSFDEFLGRRADV